MKILFTSDRIVSNALKGTDKEARFEAGKVYDLADTSVDRWVRRNAGTTDPDKIAAAEAKAGGARADVEIPADWAKLPTAKMVALANSIGGQKITKVADAAAFIVKALFARAGMLEIRTELNGDVRSYSVLKPFPAYVLVNDAFLADPASAAAVKVDGERLEVSFVNGQADYLRVAQLDGVSAYQLEDCHFEEPKPVQQ